MIGKPSEVDFSTEAKEMFLQSPFSPFSIAMMWYFAVMEQILRRQNDANRSRVITMPAVTLLIDKSFTGADLELRDVCLINHNWELTSNARAACRNCHFFRHNRDFAYFHPQMKIYISVRNLTE